MTSWFRQFCIYVSDIEATIRFYETLGFELIDTDRCEPLGWARMHCQGGALMLLRAEHPPAAQWGYSGDIGPAVIEAVLERRSV